MTTAITFIQLFMEFEVSSWLNMGYHFPSQSCFGTKTIEGEIVKQAYFIAKKLKR
jgi:hypothetical protein